MKKELKKGFVPALGTPLDENGFFLKDSFVRQIDLMLSAGAVGLLAMGSMGIQATIRFGECRKVAEAALEAAAGRVPVYVGAMDCSIARAKERLASMEDLDVAGFVFTAPYYNVVPAPKALNFFKAVAAATSHKIYLYDLPSDPIQDQLRYGDGIGSHRAEFGGNQDRRHQYDPKADADPRAARFLRDPLFGAGYVRRGLQLGCLHPS